MSKCLSKSRVLVSNIISSCPVGYDFNEKVTWLRNAIYEDHKTLQAQDELDLARHYHGLHSGRLSLSEINQLVEEVREMEFRGGQSRKAMAGAVYQVAIEKVLQTFYGLDIECPSKADFGSSIDLVLYDRDNYPLAFAVVKQTLRERFKIEGCYRHLHLSYGVPIFLVTNDEPSQPVVDEMVRLGFDVILRDEIVEDYDRSPRVHEMSRLPGLLDRLSLRLAA